MNSTLKPVLATAGVPQGGQASPAKANVAGVNHAGHPQGAQNSLHHGTNNLVGQNLTHHAPAIPPVPAHAVPSLAPVSANMAQMAQNMSHHGNLSHMGQNSVTPSNTAASPSKSASTPLSLVQDKVATPSQPLALTRTPEKKEAESTVAQANGNIDSPKSAASAPATLKPQNPEPNKEKQDIAKTSPSTPKPPEKPANAPTTPQKSEASNAVGQADGPSQPKAATATEAPEKSPSKPTEPKPAAAADVAPTQAEPKPAPESANNAPVQEKPAESAKADPPAPSEDKPDGPAKPEENKEEPKIEKATVAPVEEKKAEPVEPPKKEEKPEQAAVERNEEKKVLEQKTPVSKQVESKPAPKSTMKLATVTPPVRKRRQASPSKSTEGVTPSAKKAAEVDTTPDPRSKRNRTKVQLYQSPTPELTMATKLSASAGRSTPTKQNDDKLIVFYKNEYLAVRNAEGSFYVCQSMQNVYRSTRKIKIRWLSQDKAADPSGETYKPDFYDVTDMECVLTTLSMARAPGGAQLLTAAEAARAKSILERALKHEQGDNPNNIELTEEHPDGLDLSLYTDESQLDKKGGGGGAGTRKRHASKTSPRAKQDDNDSPSDAPTPSKRARTAAKQSPKSGPKPSPKAQNNKRKSAGSTPTVAPASKVGIVQRIYRNTATVTEKVAPLKVAKATPTKKTPAKPAKAETPPAKAPPTRGKAAKRAVREIPSPIVPTPSTSTGKTTRTPRKPPAKK